MTAAFPAPVRAPVDRPSAIGEPSTIDSLNADFHQAMPMRFSTLIATFRLGPFCCVNAADWPCWRGKDGLGVSPEKSLPTRWSQADNIAWSTAIPGRGACAPIVGGERV